MVAVGFALSAAISWGMSAILVRMGLRYMPATYGTFVSLLSSVFLMLPVVAVLELDQVGDLTISAVGLFAAVGVINFILGRYLNFLSISHLGVARATPIQGSSPLFAMVLAVVFTGESVNALTLLGTGFVLAGVYLVLKPS